jgi:hypothetical protein
MVIDAETGKIYHTTEAADQHHVKRSVGIAGEHKDVLRISAAVKAKYDLEQKRKKTGARRGARKESRGTQAQR